MLAILLWGVISPSVAQKRYRTGNVPNVQLRHGKHETGAGLEDEVRRAMSNMKEKNTDDVDGGISSILVILAVVVSAILFFAIL